MREQEQQDWWLNHDCAVRGPGCLKKVGFVCAKCIWGTRSEDEGKGGKPIRDLPPPPPPPNINDAAASSGGNRTSCLARLGRQERRLHLQPKEKLEVVARVAASRAGGVFLTGEEYDALVKLGS